MRRLGALALVLVGLALVLTDLRPLADESGVLRMQWSFAGSELSVLASLDARTFAAAIQEMLPWLAAGTLVLSIGLGWWTAASVAAKLGVRAGLGARSLASLAWALALDPWVAHFVASRGPMNAERYLDAGDAFRSLGLGFLAVATILVLGRSSGTGRVVEPKDPEPSSRFACWSVAAAMGIALVVPEAIAWLAFGHRTLVNDEFAYLFQARLFSEGRLAADLGGLADFFPSVQTQAVSGRIFPVVLPGHSAVLALGTLAGMPALLPRVLAPVSVLLTYDLGHRIGLGRPERAAWLLAISPAFLGVEALVLAHGTSLPSLLFSVWCAVVALDRAASGGRSASAVAACSGAAFSLGFAARPVTAIAIGVCTLALLARERPRGSARLLAAAVLAALPVLAGFLAIERALTGRWFHTVYGTFNLADNAVYGRIGAGTAASITLFNLSRMSTWLTGLAPGWLLPALGVAFARAHPRAWLPVAVPASLFAFHALHPFHGIPWVGPVYQSEALPFLALLSAGGSTVVDRALGVCSSRILFAYAVAASALLLALHVSAARAEIEERDRPYAAARSAGIEHGVVFLPLEDLRTMRKHPLAPPAPGASLVFARDLGPRNTELLRALGGPPSWVWDPGTSELRAR